MTHSRQKYLAGALILLVSLIHQAHAQNQALDLSRDKNTDMHPTLREGLSTLGRYAETVNRQVNSISGKPADTPSATPETPPNQPVAPTVRPARLEITNDPFEVSPQLREGRAIGGRYSGVPGASILELQRQVRLRALLMTPHGKAAMLSIKNSETITVMDKELIDLGPLGTFLIQIDRDGVALLNPAAPQGKKVVLR